MCDLSIASGISETLGETNRSKIRPSLRRVVDKGGGGDVSSAGI